MPKQVVNVPPVTFGRTEPRLDVMPEAMRRHTLAVHPDSLSISSEPSGECRSPLPVQAPPRQFGEQRTVGSWRIPLNVLYKAQPQQFGMDRQPPRRRMGLELPSIATLLILPLTDVHDPCALFVPLDIPSIEVAKLLNSRPMKQRQ